MGNYQIVIVSDGTGETAYKLLKAASLQFQEKIAITRYTNIRKEFELAEVLKAASRNPSLVIFTFVSATLRAYLEKEAEALGVDRIDLLGPLMDQLSHLFRKAPVAQPGLLHKVDDEYFARIDAIEYAIRHDDGKSTSDIGTADIILLGISRTSKTPLSVYLAQEGWRVANVPVVADIRLPRKLFEVDQRKIVGLTIDAERLAEIRHVRLQQHGAKESNYADIKRIRAELEYAHKVYSDNPLWPVIEVGGKSIEESSQELLDNLLGQGRGL